MLGRFFPFLSVTGLCLVALTVSPIPARAGDFYQATSVPYSDGTAANRYLAETPGVYQFDYGDTGSVAFTLPWPFPLYGQNHTQLIADTDGNIWFGGALGSEPVIRAWNADLNSYFGGGVFVQRLTTPNDRVVIHWQSETFASAGSGQSNDLAVVLLPSGEIHILYQGFTAPASEDYNSGIFSAGGTAPLSLTTLFGSVPSLANTSYQITVDLGADADGDGMTNGWELTYGFNPLDPADAALDNDGDGIPNRIDRTPLVSGYFPAPVSSSLSATFFGSADDDDPNLPGSLRQAAVNDELAVFDATGVLSGRAVIATAGQYSPLTVYGDDPATTGIDEGATAGETLTAVFWDKARLQELPVRVLDANGARSALVWNSGANTDRNMLGLAQSRIGTFQIFGSGEAAWFRDADNNGQWTPESLGGLDLAPAYFGTYAMKPIVADWNGDGFSEIGAFENGVWYLDRNGNGVWDGDGAGLDRMVTFGTYAMTPIAGDWNGDGVVEIGAFENGQWFLDVNNNGIWDGTAGGDRLLSFGTGAMIPVVGDWTGDGVIKIGAFESGTWYLDANGNGTWDGTGPGLDMLYSFGSAAMLPVVGDWTGDGRTKIGAFDNGVWYLDVNGNGAWDAGADRYVPAFGISGDKPVTGVWK